MEMAAFSCLYIALIAVLNGVYGVTETECHTQYGWGWVYAGRFIHYFGCYTYAGEQKGQH